MNLTNSNNLGDVKICRTKRGLVAVGIVLVNVLRCDLRALFYTAQYWNNDIFNANNKLIAAGQISNDKFDNKYG